MARTTAKSEREQKENKEKELRQAEREQLSMSMLDNPSKPGEASAPRGWAYFVIILVVALALNIVALVVISGGS
jgi:hypothetical protein